jgi:hypothetical protein
MFYTGAGADEMTDDHEGYVAGRYRDGTRSDIWTDVTRCADATFLAYLPACECGWLGADRDYTESGFRACKRAWLDEHFIPDIAPNIRTQSATPRRVSDADFDWGAEADHCTR